MLSSDGIEKLSGALAKMQGAITFAEKSRVNPHFKTAYATLGDVWDAIRKPLTDNGLSIVQATRVDGQSVILTTALLHSSGQWVMSEYPVMPVRPDPQGWGSALSYARRYSLMALTGVCPEDDDGNAASSGSAAPASAIHGFGRAPAPAAAPQPVALAKKPAGGWSIPVKSNDWSGWTKTMVEKFDKTPDLKSYEKLFGDNSDTLLALSKVDDKLHDSVIAAANAVKAKLTKEGDNG